MAMGDQLVDRGSRLELCCGDGIVAPQFGILETQTTLLQRVLIKQLKLH